MAEDNSNDRSQALVRVADAYPQPIIDITSGSDMDSGSPMGLMKNVTPGAGPDAAAPVAMSATDSVITLLGLILDELGSIRIDTRDTFQAVAEAAGWLSLIYHQQEAIADAEAGARREELQDASEAGAFGGAAEVAEVKDSRAKRVFGGVKEGAGKIMGGFGSILKKLAGGFGVLLLPIAAVIGAFAIKAALIIGALGTAIVFFKDTNWEDMLEPLKGAFAFVKDIALSLWDHLKKVVDVIEVAFMPMLRFAGDALNDYLIQPLLSFLVPFWNDTLSPLVDKFGEGLVTIKNFFKGIQDLRGAELRTAIVGGFMKMIDSLWDSIAKSKFGRMLGMDTNEEKRAQEFEKRREAVRQQRTELEGRDRWGERYDTGIMALPENERATARARADAGLERELAQIDAEEAAAASTPDATEAAIARGEAMADKPGVVRQSMSLIESGVSAVGQAGSDAYAGLRIKGSSGQTQIGGSGQATGGGKSHKGVTDLAGMIQGNVPGLTRFTAFNDNYHQASNKSLHAKGLALDFTIDGGKSAAPKAAATVRRIIADAGVSPGGADVIDEYTSPSSKATAGHIHVEFNTEDAAMEMAGGSLNESPVHVASAPWPSPSRPSLLAGGGTPASAAQLPSVPGASRSGAGVATATARHASQTEAAPMIVANVGGPSVPATPAAQPQLMPFPIVVNAHSEDQTLRALQSVNNV